MVQTEQNQIVKRGMFGEISYSVAKSFFDKIGVEINGNKAGKL